MIVEHDMSVVFGLADRISVLVYGANHRHGRAGRDPSEPAVREAYLGTGGALMLEVRDLHAYYGKSHILQGVNLDVRRRGGEPAGPQRRRPLDHRQGDHGRGRAARATILFKGQEIAGLASIASRASGSATCRRTAISFRR